MHAMPESEPEDNMNGMSGMTTTLMGMNSSGMNGSSSGMKMNMGMNMDMPGMTMYFHDGYEEYILFSDLLTKSRGAFAGACIAVFFLGVFYELLKHGREVLQRRHGLNKPRSFNVNGTSGVDLKSVGSAMFSSLHLIQTVLHGLQILISYCLMLLFMTYNAYLCLCVILGITFGYFLVGWNRSSTEDANETCH